MNESFKKPDFSKKDLELRFEDNVICIYGTAGGLRKLAELLVRPRLLLFSQG